MNGMLLKREEGTHFGKIWIPAEGFWGDYKGRDTRSELDVASETELAAGID